MKIWIAFLMMICLANVAIAENGETESYQPRQVFDLALHLSNSTGDVSNATCAVQVRNATFNVVMEMNLTPKGGGWYNASHSENATGKYFCRHNCTSGSLYASDTCDFIIKGDEKMSTAIAIILLGASMFFFIFSYLTDRKHIALKLFFLIISMILVLIMLNFSHIMAIDNGASQAVISLLATLYRVGLYSFVIFCFYIVAYHVLWPTFMHFKQYGKI